MSEAVETTNDDPAADAAAVEASMAAAFERARGGTAAPMDAPPQDEPPPEPTPEPTGESDQHVEAKAPEPPPAVKQEDPNEKRFRNLDGKFGTLHRDVQKMAADLAKLANPAASPSAAQIAAANTDAKMANLREIYPDFADGMDEQIAKLRETMIDRDTAKKIVDDAVAEGVGAGLELGHITSEAIYLARSGQWQSNDWKKTIYSADFKTWLEGQDDDMKQKRQSDYGRDVVDVLDAFEKSRKTPVQKDPPPVPRGHRLEDSVPATRGNGPTRVEKAETVEQAMERRFRQTRGDQ